MLNTVMDAAHSSLGTRIATAVESGNVEVPMLPQVAAELMALLNDPQASQVKLSALIHRDQGLAAMVLRVASSPVYSGATRLVSLQQAISRLGMRQVSEIVIAGSVGSRVFVADGQKELLNLLWRTSLASGLFAKEIARISRKNVESAFLCGLLHDVGSPVVVQLILTEAKRLRMSVNDADFTELRTAHSATVGLTLAERWQLPSTVREAIVYRNRYEQAPQHRYEAQATCFATHLAAYCLSPGAMDEATLRQHPVVTDLNLYPKDVDALLSQCERVLASVDLFKP